MKCIQRREREEKKIIHIIKVNPIAPAMIRKRTFGVHIFFSSLHSSAWRLWWILSFIIACLCVFFLYFNFILQTTIQIRTDVFYTYIVIASGWVRRSRSLFDFFFWVGKFFRAYLNWSIVIFVVHAGPKIGSNLGRSIQHLNYYWKQNYVVGFFSASNNRKTNQNYKQQ